jgi:tetratricopeptide (TPR) repeat protein
LQEIKTEKILYLFQEFLKMPKQKQPSVNKKVIPEKNKTSIQNKNRKVFLYAALIALLTIIVFSNSIKNGFVRNYDDILYITSAENAKALTVNDIGTIFSSYVAGIYHPVTVLSLAIEYNLLGPSATHFHLINLLIHVLNVLLVFWFIYLLTKRIEISIIVALFFGIHPMHVESVSWISERKDVLYTFFFLGSLIAYLKYISSETKYKYLAYSIILFSLSLLSKSAAVCLAPLIVLIDYYLKRKYVFKVCLEKIPYFILALIFGIVSLISQSSSGAINSLTEFNYSFIDRIFLVCYSIMFYIIKAIAPFNLSIIHYYPTKLSFWYYFAPLGIAALIFLIIKLKNIRRDLLFGLLFFLITIILVLQFIPVGYSIVSERYSYIPFIGLFFIAGKLYCDFTDNKFNNFSKVRKKYILFFIAVLTVLFSMMTYERNKVWENSVTLFDDVIKKNPGTGHAYWARGSAKLDIDNIQGALSDFEKAIENNYKYADAYNSRAKCYFKLGFAEKAIEGYTDAIKVDNTFALAYYNRGHSKQKLEDYNGSIDDYKKAIEYNITNPALVYNELSFSQYSLNKLEDALYSVNKAIELEPSYANEYLVDKARIEYLLKDFVNSLKDFNKAIENNPNNEPAYYYRGLLKIEMKDTSGACSDFGISSELGNARASEALKLYCTKK